MQSLGSALLAQNKCLTFTTGLGIRKGSFCSQNVSHDSNAGNQIGKFISEMYVLSYRTRAVMSAH